MATAEDIKFRFTAQDDISKQLKSVNAEFGKLAQNAKVGATSVIKASSDAGRGLAGMGRNAGMAGIQVQQLVGQIQAGTNPMLALSQQAADLGFVLGAPLVGAIAGIGASIAMTLLPSLFETEKTLEEINEEFGDFDKNLRTITSDFENMNGALQQSTLAQVSATLGLQAQEAKKLGTEYAQLISKLEVAFVLYGSLENVLEKASGKDVERLRAVIIEQAKLNAQIEKTRRLESDIRAANLSEEQQAADDALRLFFENEDRKDQRLMERGTALKNALAYTKKIEEEDFQFKQDWIADQIQFEHDTKMEAEKKLQDGLRNLRALGYDSQRADLRNNYNAQLALVDEYEKSKTDLEFNAEKARAQIKERATADAVQQFSQGITALGQYNKKAFAISKAVRTGEAIMNTYAGVTQALANYPPPISYVAAAGQLAFGMAQVAQIKSQSFQGRAVGGRVEGGTPYMVGEQGREMFIPSTRGQIVKNSDVERMGGSGGAVNVNFTINAVDARGFDELLTSRRGQIVNMVNQAMNDRGRAGVV